MEKISGEKLKKDYFTTETKLANIIYKVEKKFDLIINEYPKYLTDEDKSFIITNSLLNLDISTKLDIIIRTEDNYTKQTSNQIGLFD